MLSCRLSNFSLVNAADGGYGSRDNSDALDLSEPV